jgi:actin-like ATPase involved in cell morphogenesis
MSTPYYLAIDVGAQSTAAAVSRHLGNGALKTDPVDLGGPDGDAPSGIFVGADEILFGTAAQERGIDEPGRWVDGYVDRIGDGEQIEVDGDRFPPEQLFAWAAGSTVDAVSAQEGRRPDGICITIPLAWDDDRIDLVEAALAREGLGSVEFIAGPVAAAAYYATVHPNDAGSTVVVYDLDEDGAEVVVIDIDGRGTVEHVAPPIAAAGFGGAAFAEALRQRIVPAGASVDDETLRAIADAKEALSFEEAVEVPVTVNGVDDTVLVTRADLEAAIAPQLEQTLPAVAAAVEAAEATIADIDAIVLTGGSSRIPLVARRLAEAFAVPVVADLDPGSVIVIGAASLLADAAAIVPPPPYVPGMLGAAALVGAGAGAAHAAGATRAGVRTGASAEAPPWWRRRGGIAALAGGAVLLVGAIAVSTAYAVGSVSPGAAAAPMPVARADASTSPTRSASPSAPAKSTGPTASPNPSASADAAPDVPANPRTRSMELATDAPVAPPADEGAAPSAPGVRPTTPSKPTTPTKPSQPGPGTSTPPPDPTQTAEPDPDPTQTEEPEPDPTQTEEPEPDPTQTEEPEPDPTQTEEPEPDPTQTEEPEPDPTQTEEPEPDPTQTEEPEPDPSPSDTSTDSP